MFSRALVYWLLCGSLFLSLAPAAAAQKGEEGAEIPSLSMKIFEAINAFRKAQGRPLLTLSPTLTAAAQLHSHDMAQHGFFDHTSPISGRARPQDRAVLSGYSSTFISENLFMSMGMDVSQVVSQCLNAWVNSSGHLRNLLDTQRTEVGVGVASNAQDELYVTAVFGRP